jgi:hypothetical protein
MDTGDRRADGFEGKSRFDVAVRARSSKEEDSRIGHQTSFLCRDWGLLPVWGPRLNAAATPPQPNKVAES